MKEKLIYKPEEITLKKSLSRVFNFQSSNYHKFLFSKKKEDYYSLHNLFKLYFPIETLHNNEIRRIDYIDCKVEEPIYDKDFCLNNLITYQSNVKLKLKFSIGKDVIIKNLFLFSIPLISDKGYFIINGLKRVFLTQSVRTSGVHFNKDHKNLAKIISVFGSKITFFIKNKIIWIKYKEYTINMFIFVLALDFFKDFNDFCSNFFKVVKKYNKNDFFKGYFFILDKKICNFINWDDLLNFQKKFNIDFKDIIIYGYDFNNELLFNTLLNVKEFEKSFIIKAVASLLLKSEELLNLEKSKNLINDIFFNPLKYNLDFSGRYFMNKQLNINVDEKNVLLTSLDIIGIIKNILLIFLDKKYIYPEDHLIYKILKSCGELIYLKIFKTLLDYRPTIMDTLFLFKDYNKLKEHLNNDIDISNNNDISEKNIKSFKNTIIKKNQKNLNLNENKTEYYVKLINNLFSFQYLNTAIQRFFTKNELCQLLDDTNPLSILSHITRQTLTGNRGLDEKFATFKVRDLKLDTYNRVCPIQTPENAKIGLNLNCTMYSEIYNGRAFCPYYKVINTKVIKNKVYMLNIFDERNMFLANFQTKLNKDNQIIDTKVMCRYNDDFLMVEKEKVNYIEFSSMQSVSLAAVNIPFLSKSDCNRASLATNHIRQMVPILGGEKPLVGTGIERIVTQFCDTIILSPVDGIIKYVDCFRIEIKVKNKIHIIKFQEFEKNNKFTCSKMIPVVKVGDIVKKGDLLTDNISTQNGCLSLGYNAKIAIMASEGFNYEDAIVINEKLRNKDIFTSYFVKDIVFDILHTKYGVEICSNKVFNIPDRFKDTLSEDGIIKIGSKIKKGDLLLAKLRPIKKTRSVGLDSFIKSLAGGELTSYYEEIFHYEDSGIEGTVVEIKKIKNLGYFNTDISEKIVIRVISEHIARVGDKFANRYGSKSVVSRFCPEEDMPYTADGVAVDIITNPIGIISRMNLSQIVESNLNLLVEYDLMKYEDIVCFDNIRIQKKIADLLDEKIVNNGKVLLFDGVTGEPFKQKITFGAQYFVKLEHMAVIKKNSRATGPYNRITEQPTQGKTRLGGQRISNLHTSTLIAYGLGGIIRETMNERSDDLKGRCETFTDIIKDKPLVKQYRNSEITKLFHSYLNSIGIGIKVGDIVSENGDCQKFPEIDKCIKQFYATNKKNKK